MICLRGYFPTTLGEIIAEKEAKGWELWHRYARLEIFRGHLDLSDPTYSPSPYDAIRVNYDDEPVPTDWDRQRWDLKPVEDYDWNKGPG